MQTIICELKKASNESLTMTSTHKGISYFIRSDHWNLSAAACYILRATVGREEAVKRTMRVLVEGSISRSRQRTSRAWVELNRFPSIFAAAPLGAHSVIGAQLQQRRQQQTCTLGTLGALSNNTCLKSVGTQVEIFVQDAFRRIPWVSTVNDTSLR